MKTALLITILVLCGACGHGANPETKFIGLWEYTSGTREGVSCFKREAESTSLVGKQTLFTPNESWKGTPEEVSVLGSFSPCEGEVWLVSDTGATLRSTRVCPIGTTVGAPGIQEQTFTGALAFQGQALAVEWNQRIDWFHLNDGKKVIFETCTYTFKNAILRYVGPYIP